MTSCGADAAPASRLATLSAVKLGVASANDTNPLPLIAGVTSTVGVAAAANGNELPSGSADASAGAFEYVIVRSRQVVSGMRVNSFPAVETNRQVNDSCLHVRDGRTPPCKPEG